MGRYCSWAASGIGFAESYSAGYAVKVGISLPHCILSLRHDPPGWAQHAWEALYLKAVRRGWSNEAWQSSRSAEAALLPPSSGSSQLPSHPLSRALRHAARQTLPPPPLRPFPSLRRRLLREAAGGGEVLEDEIRDMEVMVANKFKRRVPAHALPYKVGCS